MSIPGIGRVLKDAGIEHTLTDGWKDRVWVRDGKPFDWDEIRSVSSIHRRVRRPLSSVARTPPPSSGSSTGRATTPTRC